MVLGPSPDFRRQVTLGCLWEGCVVLGESEAWVPAWGFIELWSRKSSLSTTFVKLKWEKRLFREKFKERRNTELRDFWWLWTPSPSHSSGREGGWHLSTWLSFTHISQNRFHMLFWLEWNTNDVLRGIPEAWAKAVILFLGLTRSSRGTCCSTCALSLIYRLAFAFVGKQPGLHGLHLPSETPTDSPTPGAHACLALWQRAPASLCPLGPQVVKEWHRFRVILIGLAHVQSVFVIALSHFIPSFTTWQLALQQKQRQQPRGNLLASLYDCIGQILIVSSLVCLCLCVCLCVCTRACACVCTFD